MTMSSKRKLDMGDAEFEFLHDYLVQLSKTSIADSKSMLLMIKSLAPNSIKLKQVEYEMAKDNGDTNTAAHLLSQLCSSSREVLSEEIGNLFDGLRKSPPDKTSLDIFTRLSHSTQRELFNILFSRSSYSVSEKADLLLYLLSLKEIQSEVQLVPGIVSLAYRALRDGEASLAKCSELFQTPKVNPPASVPRTESSKSPNNARSALRLGDGEEGEEGEVLGDDDEDDDSLLETKVDTDDANSFKRSTATCEFRRKLAYELLPSTYQVLNTVKLDKRLLEKVVNMSLNFLFESIASLVDNSSVSASEKKLCKLVKPPTEYLVDCLNMSAAFLQWPLNIFVKQESSTESTQLVNSATLKSSNELLTLLDDSWEEIVSDQKQSNHSLDAEGSLRKRRSGQRREDAAHTSTKISTLAHQFTALFWTLVLEAAKKHISLTRPSFIASSIVDSDKQLCSSYPLDISLLFPSNTMTIEPFTPDSTATSLSTLVHLWQYRKYKNVPDTYTLGSFELDMWDAAVRPSLRPSTINQVPSLEQIVCFDLTLSGTLRTPWTMRSPNSSILHEMLFVADLIALVCPKSDQKFVHWILSACSFNPFTQKPWNNLIQNRENFVRNLNCVSNEAPDLDACPIRILETCWLIPLTQQNISYLGCKVIAHWLWSTIPQDQLELSATNLEAVGLTCVLCQVDTLSKQDAFLAKILPIPCQKTLELIEQNWSNVRDRFLSWITRPVSAVVDSSLINELVRIEAAWLVKAGTDQSEFMNACVNCMKSQSTESICTRLLRFVSTEINRILSCVKNASRTTL